MRKLSFAPGDPAPTETVGARVGIRTDISSLPGSRGLRPGINWVALLVKGTSPDSPFTMIRLIAAMDSRRGIATASGIPWKLPGDTAYFHDRTATGLILMGRATYSEFAAPLHERDNFVLTTGPEPLREGFRPIGSLDQLVTENPGEDVWVIGGAAVYAETISEAGELLLTQVSGDFDCTKFFPPYQTEFRLATQSDDRQDGETKYRFETWRRLSSKPQSSSRFAGSQSTQSPMS